MNNIMLKNLTLDLIKKYDVSCPYYTSYPTLSEWSNDFLYHDYMHGLNDLGATIDIPLLLYVHFPFCAKQCYYCICNSTITRNREKIQKFLDHLFREIDLLRGFFEKNSCIPKFKRIHLGGGSPTLLEIDEFELLIEKLKSLVDISSVDEFAIEVDVHTTNSEKLKCYYEKGVNRISLGIQDFDSNVQKAVNRVISPESVDELLSPEIRQCFKSINFDLLYGLPLQNRISFRNTIEVVKNLSPDRITLLKYAHVPDRRKHQRLIKESDIPDVYEKTMIFAETINNLLSYGYEYVGIDNFAKSADDLAKAMQNKTLWRNFNGFTPGRMHHILGIGPTSTHSFTNYYAQNVYSLQDYYKCIDNHEFPILRGFKLDNDDLIRRDVINEILCNCSLDFCGIELKYKLDFKNYFKQEVESLNDFKQDGLIESSHKMIKVTPLGRIFVRHICKTFDNFLKGGKNYKITGP